MEGRRRPTEWDGCSGGMGAEGRGRRVKGRRGRRLETNDAFVCLSSQPANRNEFSTELSSRMLIISPGLSEFSKDFDESLTQFLEFHYTLPLPYRRIFAKSIWISLETTKYARGDRRSDRSFFFFSQDGNLLIITFLIKRCEFTIRVGGRNGERSCKAG